MTNYPWPMDKDLGYFVFLADGFNALGQKDAHDTVKYLLDRLKIAEQNVNNTEYQYSLFRRGAELTHNEMVEKLKIAEAERDRLQEWIDYWN